MGRLRRAPATWTVGRATPRVERRNPSAILSALLVLSVSVLASCGKRGAPLPPEPRGPLPPRLVEARQIGETALVSFEVPRARGPKPAQAPTRAELIRVDYSPGIEAPVDPDAFRRRGQLVAAFDGVGLDQGSMRRLVDRTLVDSADFRAGSTLRYAIRVMDKKGRSSPLVVAEDLVLIASVPGPRQLVAEPTADGVRLTWRAPGAEAPLRYNVYRAAPGSPPPLAPLNPAPLQATEFLDPDTLPGRRYVYVARVVLADGRPYREGETSAPITVLSEDRFAPAAPTGLVGVQERMAVRLFWNPSSERDLAGYRIYRRTGEGEFESIGPDLVGQPFYLDSEVEPGQHLSYRITAVDRAEMPNESEPSGVFELVVVEEPVERDGGER